MPSNDEAVFGIPQIQCPSCQQLLDISGKRIDKSSYWNGVIAKCFRKINRGRSGGGGEWSNGGGVWYDRNIINRRK